MCTNLKVDYPYYYYYYYHYYYYYYYYYFNQLGSSSSTPKFNVSSPSALSSRDAEDELLVDPPYTGDVGVNVETEAISGGHVTFLALVAL